MIVSFCDASMSKTSESRTRRPEGLRERALLAEQKRVRGRPGVRIFMSVVTMPSRNVTRSEPVSRILARVAPNRSCRRESGPRGPPPSTGP